MPCARLEAIKAITTGSTALERSCAICSVTPPPSRYALEEISTNASKPNSTATAPYTPALHAVRVGSSGSKSLSERSSDTLQSLIRAVSYNARVTPAQQLEGLRDLASLEGFARLGDLEALLAIAVTAPLTLQTQLLEAASAIFEGRKVEQPVALEPLTRVIELMTTRGLEASDYRSLDGAINAILTALEDAHRVASVHPLEASCVAALEALKNSVFGRALNIAERSRLRGFYEREKLLKRW